MYLSADVHRDGHLVVLGGTLLYLVLEAVVSHELSGNLFIRCAMD